MASPATLATPAAKAGRPKRRAGGWLIVGAVNALVIGALGVIAFGPPAFGPEPRANAAPGPIATRPVTTVPITTASLPAPGQPSAPTVAGAEPEDATRIAAPILPDVTPRATRVAGATQRVSDAAVVVASAPAVEATAQPPAVTEAPAAPSAAPPPPAVARPTLPPSEAQFVKAMDALLAPVRTRALAVQDAERVRDAFANASNVATVVSLRDQIKDPVARKLVEWSLVRNGANTAREVRTFMAANPDWPSRDLMLQRAEEHVFMAGGAAKDIKAYFATEVPRTAIGRAALASALLAEGDTAGATALASRAWREGEIPTLLEAGFLERFLKLLTETDHKWRLDRLLMDDERWEGDRNERAVVVRRLIPYLSTPEQAKAKARLAVYLRAADANKLLAALPADAATKPVADWGFAFQLAQWHRRAGRVMEARAILLDAPTDAASLVSPDDWWEERRIAAYAALRLNEPKVAFELAAKPGPLGVNARKDQAFLAGWIAKRHLNDAKSAEPHFKALVESADGPLSRAKGAYWLAQTYKSLGDTAKVTPLLEQAARNVDTFHGHLAMQELQPGRTRLLATPPQLPTEAEAQAFMARDAVQAVVIARRSGLESSVTRNFLNHLRNTLLTEQEHAMIAHLAEAIGDTQGAVRLAKGSVARGHNLLFYAYPIHAMPAYQPLRPPPEPALMLAIARQESEFSTAIRSGAGARGLLQVMPITANHVCKDYKLKCEIDRLSTDPAYNLKMASAYIGDRMEEFSGSYVLSIAGYNAGPGRARQWIREFGDPRDPAVDPTDWIHRIPFEETRDYVQKVMSNLQVYRARLGAPETALRVGEDLTRGVRR